jgi:amphi-Trp domain-containing protein
MSDVKLERKEVMSREQAAERLAALADALAKAGQVEMELGGVEVSLRVPGQLRSELEVQIDGDEIELELELKWSTRTMEPAPAADSGPEAARDTGTTDTGGVVPAQAAPT